MEKATTLAKPLPIKDGVSPSCLYLRSGNWETMFEFFCDSFPHISVEQCRSRFKAGEVRLQDGEVVTEKTLFIPDKKVFYYRELPNEMKVPFEETIIFENERFLIADKPHFLPVSPSGEYLHETLIVRLRKKCKIDSLELAHRLDRETAGLVLVIKKQEYRAAYHRLFSERNIIKIYHAIAKMPKDGMIFPYVRKSHIVKSSPFFLMKEDVSGNLSEQLLSESEIDVIEKGKEKTLYKLMPKTGKKHQLRVHMASLGLPIENDVFYPKLINKDKNNFSKPLQLLAKSLHFNDPFDNQHYDFVSDLKLII